MNNRSTACPPLLTQLQIATMEVSRWISAGMQVAAQNLGRVHTTASVKYSSGR